MHRPLLTLAILSAATLCLQANSVAQPGRLKAAARGEAANDAHGGRNDFEGGVWEFKIIERTDEKETALVGKFRVKNNAAFDIPGSTEGKLVDEGTLDEGGAFPGGIKPPTPKRLGILDRTAEDNRGGDRIGDVQYEKSRNSTKATPKATFLFDTDDKHPLSGEAQVKLDNQNGGGIWRGAYYEKKDGKKVRWNFELRSIED